MIVGVFSVFDAKACYFSNPFFCQREAEAIRVFSDAVRDPSPGNQWHRHPEDFSLFQIGTFDSQSGEITGQIPVSLVTASSLVVQASEPLELFPNGNISDAGAKPAAKLN